MPYTFITQADVNIYTLKVILGNCMLNEAEKGLSLINPDTAMIFYRTNDN